MHEAYTPPYFSRQCESNMHHSILSQDTNMCRGSHSGILMWRRGHVKGKGGLICESRKSMTEKKHAKPVSIIHEEGVYKRRPTLKASHDIIRWFR